MSNAFNLNDIKEECIEGAIYNMSPSAHYRHSEVIGNIYHGLKNYFKNSICGVFSDNIDIHFDKESKDYVIPDISIVCDKSKFKGGSYYGVPKFVAEVLSPATRHKDLTIKKELYESKGISEYWTIDYASKSIDIYHLIDAKYKLINACTLVEDEELEGYNIGTIIKLKEFPNIEIKLEDIFE